MRIEYAIVGHRSRRESATKLARSLSAALAMDEGDRGPLLNHDLAWRMEEDGFTSTFTSAR